MDDALPLPSAPSDTACRFTVETSGDDDVVVAVIGDLDPPSSRVLLRLVEATIGRPGTSRGIELDLRRLRACSNSGVRALTACAELGVRLREGLHFRIGTAPQGAEYQREGSVRLNP
jgi:hypothetical protein